MSLDELKPGESCIVIKNLSKGSIRRRFQDIGLIEGTSVTCLHASPPGDPCAYLIRGAVIAIRKKDSCSILVQISTQSSASCPKGENGL